MDKSHIEAFKGLFNNIYKGHQESIDFSLTLLETAHAWDDIFDKDLELGGDSIYKALLNSVFRLSEYSLWDSAGLKHHVLSCFLQWRDANTIEGCSSSSDDDLNKCYMLRAGIYDIFVIIAFHLHGDEWSANVGPLVRTFYGEKLPEYIKEMRLKHA